ncbi:MAG TPA: hypothetical protein ENK11_02285 [Phycisphaerales bacterium]|nr:hypothetical protein [Phycisphaerales bacterium]
MNKVLLRWILPTSAALVFGPLVGAVVASLHDDAGSTETTLLLSSAPVMGVLALILVAAVAGIGGAITGRLTLPGTGRTFAGLVVAWAAMRTGASWDIFMSHGGSVVVPLAIEGVLVAAAAAAVVVLLVAGEGTRDARTIREDLAAALTGKSALIGLLVGVIGGGIGAYLVAVDGGRGQGMMGGVIGGVLCAVGVQLASADLPPERARLRASAAMLLLMVLSPLSLLVMPGTGAVSDAARAGTLFGPGLVQPLDWFVGILLGVPTGMAWVGSVSERAQQRVAGA